MKSPLDYLPPADPTAPPGYILLAHARQALERQAAEAADEKQRYAHLLVRAVLNSKSATP